MRLSAFIFVLLGLSGLPQYIQGYTEKDLLQAVEFPFSFGESLNLTDNFFSQKLDHFVNKTPEWQQVDFSNPRYDTTMHFEPFI
jgi:hypothetical protein